MSTIQTLFQQAQLAEAAYAKFDQVALANDALIRGVQVVSGSARVLGGRRDSHHARAGRFQL